MIQTESITRTPSTDPDRSEHRDDVAEAVRRRSADGRPAHPEMGPRRIGLLLAAVVFGILVVAGLVGWLVEPMFGVVLALLGVGLFLAGPAFWAAVVRAGERRRAREELRRECTADQASAPDEPRR